MKKVILVLLPAILISGAAEILFRVGILPPFLFASPLQVVQTLNQDFSIFAAAFRETALAASMGFVISAITGVLFAILLSLSTTLKEMIYPYAVLFQTVPIIAIAPLLVIWFGYGLPTVIASATIASVFPVIANTVNGFLLVDRNWVLLFKTLKATKTQEVFLLRVPASLPSVFSGFKVASGLAVIGAIVGEFISGTGLGGIVDEARRQQRLDKVFAAVFLASMLGIVFFLFLNFLNQMVSKKWGTDYNSKK